MGLLGMLAAGGAMGLRDASNQSVEALNRIELETMREELRQNYLDRRYQQRREDAIEGGKIKALLDQTNYERERAGKLQDDEAKHKRNLEIERLKNARTSASNASRIEAAKIRSGYGNSVVSDGAAFNPKSPEGKAAQDLVDSKVAKNLPEAYEIIYAKGLAGRAAGSLGGLTKGIAPEAIDMSRQFLGGRNIQEEQIPGVIRDPKTGKLILK